MTYTQDQLRTIIDQHGLWLRGEGGSRANLYGADLSGANLYKWAQVSFKGHGERGRMLTAYQQEETLEVFYQCGCFHGTAKDLIEYIAKGDEVYRKSRTIAFETVTMLLNA